MVISRDKFDTDGSLIELAELSINKPELELVTFDDESDFQREATMEVQPDGENLV